MHWCLVLFWLTTTDICHLIFGIILSKWVQIDLQKLCSHMWRKNHMFRKSRASLQGKGTEVKQKQSSVHECIVPVCDGILHAVQSMCHCATTTCVCLVGRNIEDKVGIVNTISLSPLLMGQITLSQGAVLLSTNDWTTKRKKRPAWNPNELISMI